MFRTIVALAVGCCLLCSPAAAQRDPTGPANGPAVAAGAPAKLAPLAGVSEMSAEKTLSYKLGPGDQLAIITFDEPQLTGNFFVGADGTVSLPWLGDLQAGGRTVRELRADIEARLKNGFIVNPAVSLQVIALRPFYILGEVNKPGQYPYIAGMTVMSAVATAGGFTYRAKTSKVFIKHPGEDFEDAVPLSAATPVAAGDTIRIAERYF